MDMSTVATDTIDYVATDSWGNTATSTRTIIVSAASSSPGSMTISPGCYFRSCPLTGHAADIPKSKRMTVKGHRTPLLRPRAVLFTNALFQFARLSYHEAFGAFFAQTAT